MNRSKRTTIARQTLQILEQGEYRNSAGEVINIMPDISAAIASAKLYRPDDFPALQQGLQAVADSGETNFSVVNQTTLQAAAELLAKVNDKVTCLNFASAKNPGGGFLNGSQAQEESLARSTSLYPTLLKNEEYYTLHRRCRTCLYTDHMIYSPGVLVLRDDKGALLDTPFPIDVITSPAVNAGAVRKNEANNIGQLEPVMRQRMLNFLLLCINEGCFNLVLGAWGCGVFMNDPALIARMWYELLVEEPRLQKYFKNICFAVLDRRERGTYATFCQQFEPLMSVVEV